MRLLGSRPPACTRDQRPARHLTAAPHPPVPTRRRIAASSLAPPRQPVLRPRLRPRGQCPRAARRAAALRTSSPATRAPPKVVARAVSAGAVVAGTDREPLHVGQTSFHAFVRKVVTSCVILRDIETASYLISSCQNSSASLLPSARLVFRRPANMSAAIALSASSLDANTLFLP